jgi:hypothetical protein
MAVWMRCRGGAPLQFTKMTSPAPHTNNGYICHHHRTSFIGVLMIAMVARSCRSGTRLSQQVDEKIITLHFWSSDSLKSTAA